MSQISLKSISGITSITTPAGVDNQFTLHTNNTSQALKLDSAGNIHVHNHINTTGVSTASNFKTGTSNLHNTGLNVQDLDVDGHTNLDNVSISGVTTVSGILDATNTPASIRVAQDIQHKGDANTKITFPANDTISFDTGGNERLRIASDGKVGISETSPQALLHLNDGANSAIMFGNTTNGYKIRANVTSSNDYGLLIEDEDGVDLYRATSSTGTTNADTHTFFTAGSERLRIESDGDFRFSSDDAGTNYGWIRGWQSATGDMIIGADQSATGSSGSNLIFRSRGSEKMRIHSSGDVSIGRDSVLGSAKLSIQCDAAEPGISVQLNSSSGTDEPSDKLYSGPTSSPETERSDSLARANSASNLNSSA